MHLFISRARDTNPAGLCDPFQPSGHVHSIAVDVVIIDDDVTNVDAYAEFDPPLPWDVRVALGHSTLDINGTAQGIYDACELDQQPIAGSLHDPSAIFGDLRV